MSLNELTIVNGIQRTITVDEIRITNDPIEPRDGITLEYFNTHLPPSGGNMNFIGVVPALIGQHYLTAGTSAVNADKSAMVEDTTSISFGSKDLSLIGDVQADKYIVNGGTASELLAGDGSLVLISSIPDGNVKYTPISGNIGSHYQQSSLDGQNCIESNLSEDAFNFYFGNRSIQDIGSVNCDRVNAINQLFTGNLGGSNTLITNNEVLIQNATTSNTKVNINGVEVKDNTSTTTYKARTITDPIELNLTTPTITSNGNITANSFAIPFGTNQYVLLADGTTAPYVSGGQSNLYLYRSSTNPTPTILGRIQWNTLPQNTATTIYINHLTDDNIDIDPFLAQIRPDDILYIQDQVLSTNWVKYSVVSTTVIPNSYTTINVLFIDGEGSGLSNFPNNHKIFFSIFINQDLINQRLTVLETKTRYQSSLTSNQTTFTNTLNTDIVYANHMYKIGDGEYITNTEADATYLKIVNEANPLPITLSSSGSGTSLLNDTTNPSFSTKSLAVSTGLSIGSTIDLITLTNSSPASSISVSNVGAGSSLIVSNTNPSFTFKSLSASTGINLNDIANNLQIVNSSPATIISVADATTGISLIGSSTNPNFTFKTLVAGTDIVIGDIANQLTISSTAGSSVNLSNGGSNLSLVASTSANPNLKTKSISASTGIIINDVSNNLEIVNSSPLSNLSITSSGTGYTIWKTLSNPSYISKGFLEGVGISFNITTESITINNSSPASSITLTSSGFATSLLNSTINPNFTTKSLAVSSGLSIGSTTDTITLTNSSPASSISVSNAGAGSSLVASTSSNPSFTLKSVSASTGISITDSSNNLQITNSSPASLISIASSGTGTSLLNSTTNPNFTTKSLAVGTGLSIASTSDTITLTNTITGSTLTSAGAGTTLVVSGSAPSLSVKSLSGGIGITLSDVSNNLQIINSSPASGITLTNDGLGTYSLIGSTSSNPTLKNKTLNAGTGITINDSSNILTITNSQPSGNITLTNAGTTSLIATASSNPAFQTKGLVAGSNITLSTTGTDITINASGGSGITTSWDFLPMNIGIKNALLSLNSYFNLAIVPSTITINTIKFFLPDPLGSSQIVRWALYKGLLSGSGAVLQAQAVDTIPTNAFGIYTMTFVVESGKSLTFSAGDAIFLGFNGSISVQTFVSSASSDLDNCFYVATSYNAGFPATISTGLSRVSTNIHNCALFNT